MCNSLRRKGGRRSSAENSFKKFTSNFRLTPFLICFVHFVIFSYLVGCEISVLDMRWPAYDLHRRVFISSFLSCLSFSLCYFSYRLAKFCSSQLQSYQKTQRDIYITYLSCAEAVKSRCVFVIVKSNGNNSWISFYLLQIFPHAYLDSLSWYITWRLMDTKWFQSDEPVIFPPSYLRYPWILHNSHFGLSRWICWVPNGQTPKHYILHFP